MAVVMDQDHRSARDFLIGNSSSTRLWRLGGIVISCLADVPIMVSMHDLPIGRFMC
jgi:hypothetical protein